MHVLKFTVFSWTLGIKMLEHHSRAKGINMLEFTAFSWVLELIILEFKALSRIEGLKVLEFTAFSWVVEHTASPWRIFAHLAHPIRPPPNGHTRETGTIWQRMRLFYLQLRSFYLQFVFFTHGGGTVSKKDRTQFLDGGNRKTKPNFRTGGNRRQKRPNQFSILSKKDQTKFEL